LAVSHLFPPTELSPARRWLNRWWPSVRLRSDPLQDLLVDGRYAPVSVANWKLIPTMAKTLLARRVVRPLSFVGDRNLTIIIPFRDRDAHLQQLLPALCETLDKQYIAHRIVIVEQQDAGLFNRGRLLNVGMLYAADSTDYYCLHDVDVLPVDANYACPTQPLRLAHRMVGENGESVRTSYYFSGAISIRKEQAFAVNGFSNEYWGWGKEDDDFLFRLMLAGFLCYFDIKGTYRELPNPSHQQVQRGRVMPDYVRRNRERRSMLLRGLHEPASDGLGSLRYRITERQIHSDHEHIFVQW
jgi:hypothetical protein